MYVMRGFEGFKSLIMNELEKNITFIQVCCETNLLFKGRGISSL